MPTTELDAVTLQVFSAREETVVFSSACVRRGNLVRRDVRDALPLPDSCPQVTGIDAHLRPLRSDTTGQPNRAGVILVPSFTTP